ncbi:MAG: A/G-specific adenine glycosylase [Deltaproteobacteria bacterium]|nr:A/G-specific adenine glycosylase [Deltaproteobacteria bacterium]
MTPEKEKSILEIRKRLLKWYRSHARQLPWRQTKDPYKIWVSEIMLQQTQVKTVIPFYKKFIKIFPNLKSLARAEENEILAQWSGLGYYRRAKLLHQGAKYVFENYQGIVPEEPEELKKIPGVGPYTAGAISSIAYNRPSPLVDGNVIRVFSRIFSHPGHAKSGELHKKIWREAQQVIDPKSPGDFNQALMELGATVCRKYLPSCQRCPLQDECTSYQNNTVEQFPETPPSTQIISLTRVVAICQHQQGILFVKRHKTRWFEGMWELPHDYCQSEESAQKTLELLIKNQLKSSMTQPVKISPSIHHITHHKINSLPWHGKINKIQPCKKTFQDFGFFSLNQLKQLAIPNFERKVLQKAKIL